MQTHALVRGLHEVLQQTVCVLLLVDKHYDAAEVAVQAKQLQQLEELRLVL